MQKVIFVEEYLSWGRQSGGDMQADKEQPSHFYHPQ